MNFESAQRRGRNVYFVQRYPARLYTAVDNLADRSPVTS